MDFYIFPGGRVSQEETGRKGFIHFGELLRLARVECGMNLSSLLADGRALFRIIHLNYRIETTKFNSQRPRGHASLLDDT